MIVSALVATTERATELSRSLARDGRFQIGEVERGFLPLVATTETLREARDLYERLREHPGVTDVKLVSWTEDATTTPEVLSNEAPQPQEPS